MSAIPTVMVAIDRIKPSPNNPRKTFAAEPLKQLAESIKAHGVLQAILVRPAGGKVTSNRSGTRQSKEEYYELVAGERRWRASKLAKLTEIPVQIREFTDKEVAEVQVIENDQREDVAPLEQARGYARLIELGDDATTIAGKIGRPERYVTGRLQLLNLIPALQKDLEGEKLPFGHAWLLSKLPAGQQSAAVKEGTVYMHGGQVNSLAWLKQQIRQQALTDLSAAPWKKDDATLVPKAGACKTCPKRSGANPDLFDELLGTKDKGDYCSDRECYVGKQEAFVQLSVDRVKKEHGSVVKLTSSYMSKSKDVIAYWDVDVLTRKAAATANGKAKKAVWVDGEKAGQVVDVLMQKKRVDTSGSTDRYKAEQAKARQRGEAGKVAAEVAMKMVAEKTRAAAGSVVGWPPALGRMLRSVLIQTVSHGAADMCRLVRKRRGIETKATYQNAQGMMPTIEALKEPADMLAMLAELMAADKAQWWGRDMGENQQSTEFWSAWGVDRAALIKQAVREKEAKKKAKKKKPALVPA